MAELPPVASFVIILFETRNSVITDISQHHHAKSISDSSWEGMASINQQRGLCYTQDPEELTLYPLYSYEGAQVRRHVILT